MFYVKNSSNFPPKLISPSLEDLWLPVDRVGVLRGGRVLLVDLEGLVGLAGDETGARLVEAHLEDSRLRVEGSRLYWSLEPLEVVARLPVPEVHGPVVRTGHQHPVSVHGQAVHDGVVTAEVLYELSLWTLPLLDIVRSPAGEHEEFRMQHEASHRLLVVSESRHALPGSKVPQTDCRVITGGDHLRVGALALDGADRVGVSRQSVDVDLGPHVPDSGRGVAATRHENVQSGVKGQVIHGGQVAVVVTHYFVVLQVPALHLPVLPTGEEVGLSGGDCEAPHHTHVSSQRQLEFAAGEVPDLDDSVR